MNKTETAEKPGCKALVVPILFSIALWIVSGFFLSKQLGIIGVIISIWIAGMAAGKVMNSECPLPHE